LSHPIRDKTKKTKPSEEGIGCTIQLQANKNTRLPIALRVLKAVWFQDAKK
jgi:hypothetical protein